MKRDHSKKRTRTNAILGTVGALALGIGLLFLSRMVHASAKRAAAATQPATASAPESAPTAEPAPAAKPASPSDSPSGRKPMDTRQAANERMANLLLLFGLMAIGLAAVCAGWVVYDIRRSRPAWQTQTKYPVMEKKKNRNR